MDFKVKFKLKPIQMIAIGFAFLIISGALLLTLPISSRSGEWTNLFDCIFTTTSASCVTGLVVFDTASHWSVFGQIVILALIQVGGIGFMTVATLFAMMFGRRITLKQRGIMQESVNTDHPGGLVRLTKKIIIGTFLFEGIGALILSIRFAFDVGIPKGIYYGIFHSISAFCNAGFDLLGSDFGKYSSLCNYAGDITINLTIVLLIVIGGIGFLVWNDISTHKLNFKAYSLHSKIVLFVTGVLILAGTLFFYIVESTTGGLFEEQSGKNKFLMSLFQSVTTRTAGFNTCDIEGLTSGSKLMTIMLMFVGGSPGSTAGGIKTTTLLVLILSFVATAKGTNDLNIFKRRLEADASRKASAVVLTNMFLAIVVTMFISSNHGFPLEDVLIETFSAIGTVGLSSGITRALTGFERLLIMLLMYCGRVGSLSFAFSFTSGKAKSLRRPETKISIG